MKASFRDSLHWLHTWSGVVLGGLLFAIFWTGSLSVFDREIDRWMAPMTRLAVPEKPLTLEIVRPYYDAAAVERGREWFVILPTEREPTLRVNWRGPSGFVRHLLDPATGRSLPEPGTRGATNFLYPFHYMLHIRFGQIGWWAVGLATMSMLGLCVSGIVIHRRIFADFFALRATAKPRRLILDLHNISAVVGLPFNVVICLSGLCISYSIYFPSVMQLAYQDDRLGFGRDAFGGFSRPRTNRPGELHSLDEMIEAARRVWHGASPRFLSVAHVGDEAAYVQIGRLNETIVSDIPRTVSFDAATGALLHAGNDPAPVLSAQRFISGLHRIQFRHWTLRWLYFGLGLVGCATIATGYLFWLESRRRRHAQLGLRGVRVVESLTVGSVTGIVIATLAFFVVNRLLPLGTVLAGYDRAALEVWTFCLVWLATFGHASLRPQRAWIEQCRVVAVLALAAVLLNWLTTGDHLIRSLSHRHLWPVAGMDLMLLAGAAVAALTARKLRRRAATPPGYRGPARASPALRWPPSSGANRHPRLPRSPR